MRIGLLAVVVLVLEGCAISPSATLQKSDLRHHDFIATDSLLRVIANSEMSIFSTTGLVDPKSIVCTEPSPDVATTLANSFGVGISILGQGAGSLSAQQVQGLVQLGERTAAIQLLRDKMYQTCLAYANGAISGTSYSLIMSRLDDAIVTLSLGDAAAGAFGRKLAGVGGEASSTAEASVVGLPEEISKIEERAEKLAAANKRVDEAAKALQAQKATQPAAGKEEDYKAQTMSLETVLTKAKSERDAVLELMRSSGRIASEAAGKISRLQTGGELSARPDATILREMQADFLLTDSGRDLVFACMVELGLRGEAGNDAGLGNLTKKLAILFDKEPSGLTASNYAGAILRSRGTELGKFCRENLASLITNVATKSHEYRMHRARLNAETATARYSGESAKYSARDRELFMDAIKLCGTEFKDEADRRKACLDQIIPIKTN